MYISWLYKLVLVSIAIRLVLITSWYLLVFSTTRVCSLPKRALPSLRVHMLTLLPSDNPSFVPQWRYIHSFHSDSGWNPQQGRTFRLATHLRMRGGLGGGVSQLSSSEWWPPLSELLSSWGSENKGESKKRENKQKTFTLLHIKRNNKVPKLWIHGALL